MKRETPKQRRYKERRTPNYMVLPDGLPAIASVGKSGSTSIGKAVMETHYADKIPVWVGHDPTSGPHFWHRVPSTRSPETTVILPVRDPVERFRSAMAQNRTSDKVDEVLDKLEAGDDLLETYHLRPAVRHLHGHSNQVALYKFPEHNAELATAIGVPAIPHMHEGGVANPPKPNLTPEQETRVRAIYAEDIALHESIASAGQTVVATPYPKVIEPATEGAKRRKITELKAARDTAIYGGIELPGFGPVRTDAHTQTEITKALIATEGQPNETVVMPDWVLPTGQVIPLTRGQLKGMAAAIHANTQSAFSTFASKAAAVFAAVVSDDLDAIIVEEI